MRIAFFADSQVDERSRLVEHDRVMDFIVDDAAARGCQIALCGGDVYERRSTEVERASVRAWCQGFVSHDIPVAICGGNHEAEGEVEEIAENNDVFATERPCVRIMGNEAGGFVAVAFLPWPSRSRLLAWLGRPAGPAEVDDIARALLQDVLRGLGAELAKVDPSIPRVLVAHVSVDGYRVGPDQPAMGEGMRVSLEDLALAGADVVLLGHIHMPQEWTLPGGAPVIYAGSPRRTAYAKGELEPKGYVVVEFDGRRLVKWERVATPATPMHLVEAEWKPIHDGTFRLVHPPGSWGAGDDPTSAEIRLRYTTPADERASARIAAGNLERDWLARGAAEVKVEEVVLPTTSARAPLVAAATTYTAKLRELRIARGETLEPEREARLDGMVAELEAEVSR